MKKNNKKFSVILCVYYKDNPTFFEKAIDSIINQTMAPDEIVLVCDGPLTNELNSIIRKKVKNCDFLKVYRLEKNMGHGNARRYAIDKCKNNIVALMDSDDISVNNRFEKQIKVFNMKKNIHVVGGQIYEFKDNIEKIVGKRLLPENDSEIKEYMKKRCPMNQVTVMFKKDAVIDSGNYIDWYCEEDYYLWIRMIIKGYKFYNIQSNLVYVRVGNEMYGRRGGLKYFKSEKRVQNYMLKHKLIGYGTYLHNVLIRFVAEVLISNQIRGILYRFFLRQ